MGALSRLCYQAAFAFVCAERIIKAGNAEMMVEKAFVVCAAYSFVDYYCKNLLLFASAGI